MATQSRCTLLMAFLIIIAFSVTRVDNIVGFGVLRWLDTNSGSVTPVVRYGPKGHVVDIYVGTPPQRISALLSSSSSVIWLQARNLFPFNPRESSTLNKLPCNHSLCKSFYKLKFGCRNTSTFSQRYEDGTSVSGKMASDIFHMGDTSYNLVFGYTTKSKRYWRSVQGVLGMGRGNTSLIRQVGASRFSVCLTTSKDEERVTPLILGDAALLKPKLRNMAVRIPIVDNPSDPQHYYVALEGFSIGNRRVILPPDAFQILPNRTAGVIFDMGSQLNMLDGKVLDIVWTYIAEDMKILPRDRNVFLGSKGFCADKQLRSRWSDNPPSLTLHFLGGVDFTVPEQNYVTEEGGTKCIAFVPSPINGLSVFGNLFHQNMQVIYDLKNMTIMFAPASCVHF